MPNLEERGIMFQDSALSRHLNLTVCVSERIDCSMTTLLSRMLQTRMND